MTTDLYTDSGGQKYNGIIIAGMFLITILFCLGLYKQSRPYDSLDFFFYDKFIKTVGPAKLSDQIAIIDIDEASLAQVGQWPWPRYRLAELIRELNGMSPKTIALDILLGEPDRTSLNQLTQQFKADFRLDLKFLNIPEVLKDNDAYLAMILGQGRTVGARYFHFGHANPSSPCKFPLTPIQDESGLLNLHNATGVMCNLFVFEQVLESSGFTNSRYDSDGMLRRLPLLIRYQDQIYPHLCLATLMKAEGINEIQILKNGFGPVIKAGVHTIPITEKGETMIRFSGPAGNHGYVSAIDLLNRAVLPSRIKDKIVLIGSSAVGLNDIHHTLYDPHYPGVEVQASLLENILENQAIISPHWDRHLIAVLCVCVSLAMGMLLFYFPSPAKLLSGTLIMIGLLTAIPYFALRERSVFLSPGLPLLTAASHFVVFSFTRFILARRTAFIGFKKLALSQQLTLEAMVSMVETRDPETGAHIKRTRNYARALALYLKENDIFSETLTPAYIEMLYLSVPLHDIGKVGVPDRILLKEGPLTDDEFELMKLHTVHGRQIIERVTRKIKGENYLKMGAEIAGTHHERWNGAGYPEGLSGDEIPLSGRIMAICDVYDALISRRCYKPPFSHEKSMDLIREENGRTFDPTLVDAFFSIEEDLREIAHQYQDSIEKAPQEIRDVYMGKG